VQFVLEVACGTGRVTLRLSQDGADVVGLDLSPAMLHVAREKGGGMRHVRWVHADMRSSNLGGTFALAIIPGHSFQNIVEEEDQVDTLQAVRRHLVPDGLLAAHLDQPEIGWLGDLTGDQGGVCEIAGQFVHPKTRQRFQTLQSRAYEPANQTAVSHKIWEELGPDGEIINRLDRGAIRLHVVFRFEMEHLLARTGFTLEAVYGDFHQNGLEDASSEMVWVARPGTG